MDLDAAEANLMRNGRCLRSRRRRRPALRRAFSLVEVLIVLGIASVLLALALPGIQAARETARRTDCSQRLRQLTTATEAFFAFHNRYPLASPGGRDRHGRFVPSTSPQRQLLPHLDQTPVFQQIDLTDPGIHFGDAPPTTSNVQNAKLLRLKIAAFVCPSDPSDLARSNYRANLGFGPGFAAEAGSRCTDPGNSAGAFAAMEQLMPQDFGDGLSHTAFYCERIAGDGDPLRYDPWRDYARFAGDGTGMDSCRADQMLANCRAASVPNAVHGSYLGQCWLYGGWYHTFYNHLLEPNSTTPDCAYDGELTSGGGQAALTARSEHPGGVNLALGDGHVRFVASQIDLQVWRSLATRNARD